MKNHRLTIYCPPPLNPNIGVEGGDMIFFVILKEKMMERMLYGKMKPCKDPDHLEAHVKHHRDKEVFELFGR